jgi:hypothetical protein
MAGYKPQRKLYRLKFADEAFEGLEVTMTSASIGTLMEIQALEVDAKDKENPGGVDSFIKMVSIFSKSIVQWNLLDQDDNPLPKTVEGIKTLDTDFVMTIIGAWIEAISAVSDPLGKNSPSGEKSLELSLPMEEPSQSQTS